MHSKKWITNQKEKERRRRKSEREKSEGGEREKEKEKKMFFAKTDFSLFLERKSVISFFIHSFTEKEKEKGESGMLCQRTLKKRKIKKKKRE